MVVRNEAQREEAPLELQGPAASDIEAVGIGKGGTVAKAGGSPWRLRPSEGGGVAVVAGVGAATVVAEVPGLDPGVTSPRSDGRGRQPALPRRSSGAIGGRPRPVQAPATPPMATS